MRERSNPFKNLGWSQDDWFCANFYRKALENEGELKFIAEILKTTKDFHFKFMSFIRFAEISDISLFKDEMSQSDFDAYFPTKSGIIQISKYFVNLLEYKDFEDLIPKELLEQDESAKLITHEKRSKVFRNTSLDSDKRHCYLVTIPQVIDLFVGETYLIDTLLDYIHDAIITKKESGISDLEAQFTEYVFVIEGILSSFGALCYSCNQFKMKKFNDSIQLNNYPSYVLDSFTKIWVSTLFQSVECFFKKFSIYFMSETPVLKEVLENICLEPTFGVTSNRKTYSLNFKRNTNAPTETIDLFDKDSTLSDSKSSNFKFKNLLSADSRRFIHGIPSSDTQFSDCIDMKSILTKQSDLSRLYGSTMKPSSNVFQCFSSISDVCYHMISLGVTESMWMDSTRFESFRLDNASLSKINPEDRISFDEVSKNLKSIIEYQLLSYIYKDSFKNTEEMVLFGSNSEVVEHLTNSIIENNSFRIISKANIHPKYSESELKSLIHMKKLILEKVLNHDTQKPGLSDPKDLKEFKNYFDNELCFIPIEYNSYDLLEISGSTGHNIFTFLASFVIGSLYKNYDHGLYDTSKKSKGVNHIIKCGELISKKSKEIVCLESDSDYYGKDDEVRIYENDFYTSRRDEFRVSGKLAESDYEDEEYEPIENTTCESDDSDTELPDCEDEIDNDIDQETIIQPATLPVTFTKDNPLIGRGDRLPLKDIGVAVQAEGYAVQIHIVEKPDLIQAFYPLRYYEDVLPDKLYLKLYEKDKIEKYLKSDYYQSYYNRAYNEPEIIDPLQRADTEVQLYETIKNSKDTFLKERTPKLYMSGNFCHVDNVNGDRNGKFTLLEYIPSDLGNPINFKDIVLKTPFYNEPMFNSTLENCLQIIHSLNAKSIKLNYDISVENFSICDDGKLKIRDIFHYSNLFSNSTRVTFQHPSSFVSNYSIENFITSFGCENWEIHSVKDLEKALKGRLMAESNSYKTLFGGF